VLDIEEQLAHLRRRIARINRKFETRPDDAHLPAPPAPAPTSAARVFIEEWASGEVVENEHGPYFETEKLYQGHRRHGSADIGALADLPCDFLSVLSDGEITNVAPERWAFLDTETTGLAGGSGTYAFLIGVGRITRQGFHIRQFFMREYCEEKSLLLALSEHLQCFDLLITYNGKTYDQPLLETRYRLARQKPPFVRLQHLDLLHGARRLWKLRFENRRLSYLENQVLGFERDGDLPGEMIPYVYFEYLRSREAQRLVPIFHHNAIDILTLGCLTGIVPAAFRSTDHDSLLAAGIRRGEELLALGRWCVAADDHERGLELMKRAVDLGLPDMLLFRTLWDIARLEKKQGRCDAALAILRDLAQSRNEFRTKALEELAKHSEHTERNYALALDFTHQALALCQSEPLQKRAARLQQKLASAGTRGFF
jgi:uncharacterized protein YprB with RNaseH-like and TPR domain